MDGLLLMLLVIPLHSTTKIKVLFLIVSFLFIPSWRQLVCSLCSLFLAEPMAALQPITPTKERKRQTNPSHFNLPSLFNHKLLISFTISSFSITAGAANRSNNFISIELPILKEQFKMKWKFVCCGAALNSSFTYKDNSFHYWFIFISSIISLLSL